MIYFSYVFIIRNSDINKFIYVVQFFSFSYSKLFVLGESFPRSFFLLSFFILRNLKLRVETSTSIINKLKMKKNLQLSIIPLTRKTDLCKTRDICVRMSKKCSIDSCSCVLLRSTHNKEEMVNSQLCRVLNICSVCLSIYLHSTCAYSMTIPVFTSTREPSVNQFCLHG